MMMDLLDEAVRAIVRDELSKALADLAPGQSADSRLVVTVAEAAEMLGVSRDTMYQLISGDEVASFVEGRGLKIPVGSLREYVARRVAEGPR